MQHKIPQHSAGAYTEAMAGAVQACVHCGFCLPTCPTYRVLGEEMDSPRGRIFLMKEVLEGGLALEQTTPYLDNCLGCLACVTACPSGVQYHELLTPFRAIAEDKRPRDRLERLLRQLILETLPYPWRFRLAARLGRLAKALNFALPKRLRDMLQLLPETLAKQERLQGFYAARGKKKASVVLLAGCAQQVLEPDINSASIRLLQHCGVDVYVPREQSCCGALAAHTGAMWQAKAFAKHNLKVFLKSYGTPIDAVISNAAGCGSGLHEYPLWLKGEAEEEAAKTLAQKSQDISVFLAGLDIKISQGPEKPLRVAYHDACHLAHAQGVVLEPRQLLSNIPNVKLIDIPDSEICCGSAGTYNLEHPDIAQELGRDKAQGILATKADIVVTGNIGCLTQLKNHLAREGVPVLHLVQFLDRLLGQRPLSP